VVDHGGGDDDANEEGTEVDLAGQDRVRRRGWLRRSVPDAPPPEAPFDAPADQADLEATLATLLALTSAPIAPRVVPQQRAAEPVMPEPELVVVPPQVVVEPEPEPEMLVEPEPEPEVVVEPEPEAVVEPEPEPEPEMVVEPEPEVVSVLEPESGPDVVAEVESVIQDPTLAALFGPAAHWPDPQPEPAMTFPPVPEPVSLSIPEVAPPPAAIIEPAPEPETQAEAAPEPEALPEPDAVLEPAADHVSTAHEMTADAKPARRGRWRRRRDEDVAPEVAEALTLDANVAAFFGLTELAPLTPDQGDDGPGDEPPAIQPVALMEPEPEPEPEAVVEPEPELEPEPEPELVAFTQHDEPAALPGPGALIAAADDPIEVIDPLAAPEDSPPEDWAPQPPTTRRERKRAAKAGAVAVYRVPDRPPSRLGRLTKATGVLGLLCIFAAVPFLVPAVPSTISDLFPDKTQTPKVIDPVVDPTTGGFYGPVGLRQPGGPLAGRALVSAGSPLEVVVTRLGVDSKVIPISGQSGALLPPSDPQVLGWWQEGRGVGAEAGSAVITGHTVHTGGGAFDHLGELVPGDSIKVRTKTGWISYVVQLSRVYSTSALAQNAASIFRQEGPGRLVLITCSNFNGSIYLSNAVVYAVPVLDVPFVDAPRAKPTHKPSANPTPSSGPRIPYVPTSTPTHSAVPDNGPTPSPTTDAGNTGASGGVTPTEPPF